MCTSKVPKEFRDLIRSDSGLFELGYDYLRPLTSCFIGISGSTIHQTKSTESCTTHWWDKDVEAFGVEWIALQNAARDGGIANKEATISEFLETKKEEVVAITKVSAL